MAQVDDGALGWGVGESRRKRNAQGSMACPCGSMRIASECCFDGVEYHKAPSVLGIRALPKNSSVSKCYMRELGSCEGGISGEHLLSESIIQLLSSEGGFVVGGLPWIANGELKSIGAKALTANCLCRKHNSALHALDDAALSFFSAFKSSLALAVKHQRHLVSGHDIERWLLKTLKALAASGNLGSKHVRLSGEFTGNVNVLEMLEHPQQWPEGAGLYCAQVPGQTVDTYNVFQLMPYTNESGELGGLACNILAFGSC
jgi:hypothetical protein